MASLGVRKLDDTVYEQLRIRAAKLCVFGLQRRAASVFAEQDCTLLKINGEDFRIRIYSKELDALLICYNIAKEMTSRFRDLLHV